MSTYNSNNMIINKQNFLHEYETLALVQHENVVNLYSAYNW